MDIKEKQNFVKAHKREFLSCLNGYLDGMYSMTGTYFEDNKLKEELEPDKKTENFIKEILKDEEKYENIRKKIINDDFDLSVVELNLIGLSAMYSTILFNKSLNRIKTAKDKVEELVKVIMDTNVDTQRTRTNE